MKIAIAVHHFPPTFQGGAEWRAYRTAKGLQRAGHQVNVICVDSISDGEAGSLRYVDSEYEGIPVRRLSFSLAQAPDPMSWSFRNPLIGQHLEAWLRGLAPDIFHLISGYLLSGSAIEAAQAAHLPVVLTLTDFWFLCPRITLVDSTGGLCRRVPADPSRCGVCLLKERRRYRVLDKLSGHRLDCLLPKLRVLPPMKHWASLVRSLQARRSFLLPLLGSVDAVIAPSQFLKDLFIAEGACPPRFIYARQGLDTSRWADAEAKQDDVHLCIGYVGQVAWHKGVDLLVQAFDRLKARERPLRLLIYGDLDQFPAFVRRLRRQVSGRSDIALAGRFNNTLGRQIYSQMDLLVVPSRWYENSPNVILEAFATKTPVVTSNVGGMAELVRHEVNGLLFEMGNSQDLARQLQRVIDEPALLERLKQGIQPVKTVQKEIGELLGIYELVMTGRQV